MESRENVPEIGFNQYAAPSGVEAVPGRENSHESLQNLPETALQTEARVPQAPVLKLPILPAPVPIVSQTTVPLTSDDYTILSAADEDLIEKEWVDKAKKIIESTKDDPYRREREVSKLQIEYIRKRYGREIGRFDS